jgi:acyl-CoA thioester hydrolase
MELAVQPDDIDPMGHASNLVYVRWVLEVARAHSEAAGWDIPAYQRLGAGWVIRRHEIDYLWPAFADERLVIETWVDEWQPASALRRTRIARASDDKELACAATRWVFISFSTARPHPIPPALRQAFTSE